MSERQIDEAIDEAVRDLMNVDADAAFRARVVDETAQADVARPVLAAACQSCPGPSASR